MNRSDLIFSLRDKSSLTRKEAEKVVDTFFHSIASTLLGNDRVEIRGFGSFTVKKYKPYLGRNPKTGIPINVAPKKLPFFKVGKQLKEMVDKH